MEALGIFSSLGASADLDRTTQFLSGLDKATTVTHERGAARRLPSSECDCKASSPDPPRG